MRAVCEPSRCVGTVEDRQRGKENSKWKGLLGVVGKAVAPVIECQRCYARKKI